MKENIESLNRDINSRVRELKKKRKTMDLEMFSISLECILHRVFDQGVLTENKRIGNSILKLLQK